MLVSILRTIAFLGTLCGLAYYILCIWGARWFFRRARTAGSPAQFRPPVSILKPLCGADPNAYESFRSHCVQEYPDFEIIFGVSDPEDAAIPIVRQLMNEFPQRKIQLVLCSKFLGSNYKVSNLIQMLPMASHRFILVNDSDICVRWDYLQRVMQEFSDGRIGMVTSLYRGIAANTIGSKLESLGISTDFIPGVLSARQIEGGIHFGLGSTLAFRREALESIGGFESVADYLGDDYELGRRVAGTKYSVALAQCVVDHYLPDYSLRDYLRHQLRWARGTRNSRPRGYTGLFLTFGLPWAILAVLAAPGAAWAWSLLGLTLVARYAVAVTVGIGVLGDRRLLRYFWLIPLRDLIGVGIWLASFAGRRVVWRGNQFTLENGKLRS
jgi:ceramide glucosyltransferase